VAVGVSGEPPTLHPASTRAITTATPTGRIAARMDRAEGMDA
jgi:hypothetical protein